MAFQGRRCSNIKARRPWKADDHPEIEDFLLAWSVDLVPPKIVDIDVPQPQARFGHGGVEVNEPMWYLLSVNDLYSQHGEYARFRELEPRAIIAYSIYAYRIE